MAISDRSVASLGAPFANLPQKSSDVSATGDAAEIPDLEAETYAYAFTSLQDLEGGAYINVKASPCLPVLANFEVNLTSKIIFTG